MIGRVSVRRYPAAEEYRGAEIGWRNAEAGRRVQRLDDSVGPVTFIILNIT